MFAKPVPASEDKRGQLVTTRMRSSASATRCGATTAFGGHAAALLARDPTLGGTWGARR
jgi:hypothetical protein